MNKFVSGALFALSASALSIAAAGPRNWPAASRVVVDPPALCRTLSLGGLDRRVSLLETAALSSREPSLKARAERLMGQDVARRPLFVCEVAP